MYLMRDKFSRRKLLKAGVLGAVAATIPIGPAAALWPSGHTSSITHPTTVRELSFHNVHTGERLKTTYFENGKYVPSALLEVNHFFRDFRTNEVRVIDPRLLDLLFRIHGALDTSEPFNLISGYRSP